MLVMVFEQQALVHHIQTNSTDQFIRVLEGEQGQALIVGLVVDQQMVKGLEGMGIVVVMQAVVVVLVVEVVEVEPILV